MHELTEMKPNGTYKNKVKRKIEREREKIYRFQKLNTKHLLQEQH